MNATDPTPDPMDPLEAAEQIAAFLAAWPPVDLIERVWADKAYPLTAQALHALLVERLRWHDRLAESDQERDRITAELAALKEISRGYCPECGRGDAAPSVEDWERERHRAERLAAVVERVEFAQGEIRSLATVAEMSRAGALSAAADMLAHALAGVADADIDAPKET